MSTTLEFLTIAEAARAIASREISPVALTEALLRRIGSLDSQVNAFITVTADLAMRQARRAEAEIVAGRYRGPMHGIPFGLKDLYNTAGILTSAHSKICIDNIPDEDSTAVTRLYEAGAVLLGKLSTHEFAQGGPATDLPWPPARNPWNLEHFTGGSSSGSGAAVAAGFVLGALGSDTGGSVRGPAALCGIVGLRPTFGLVSRYGVIPNSFTFDACGPMTWTVEDCAILLQAIAGHDPKDPVSAERPIPDYRQALKSGIKGLRIGVIRHFWEEDLPASEEVRKAMDAALAVLTGLGANLEVIRMRPLQDYYAVRNIIQLPELLAIQHADLMERPGDFSSDLRGRGLAGCLFQGVDCVEAQRERRQMVEEMQALYPKYDAFVTAGNPGPAPRLDSYKTIGFWHRPNITTPFSIAGAPALVLCNGFSPQGLPLGMQVAGRPFDEETVFRVAYAYEQATAWRKRRPALVEGAAPGALSINSAEGDAPALDEQTRNIVAVFARQAGLKLNESQFAELCHAAPHAFAMVDRIKRRRDRFLEPASVFRAAD